MKNWQKIGIFGMATISLLCWGTLPNSGYVRAQVIDGVIPSHFTKSPRLLGASSTYKGVRVSYAKYYFNVSLPVDAGNSLQQVEIAQRQGVNEIKFRLDRTKAYIGTNRDKQQELAIADVTQDEATGAITVTLAEAVPPGTTFTVALKPRRNPDFGGVYLFGVTAYPKGENPYGLYLGAGRLHFYRGFDSYH